MTAKFIAFNSTAPFIKNKQQTKKAGRNGRIFLQIKEHVLSNAYADGSNTNDISGTTSDDNY